MKLLIIEDDPRAAQAIARGLRENGCTALVAGDGLEGLALAQAESFDCLVLDVGLPGLDGFAVLKSLRDSGVNTPVIFLTARDSLPDRIRGLMLGGGDYLVKPFAFSELFLRIQNLVSRGTPEVEKSYCIGDLALHLEQLKAYRGGQRLDLTPQEFTLLALLMRNAGHVVTRTRIAEELWELAFDGDPNLVDAAVRRLRKKVDDPFESKMIQTRRGMGYLIEPPDV